MSDLATSDQLSKNQEDKKKQMENKNISKAEGFELLKTALGNFKHYSHFHADFIMTKAQSNDDSMRLNEDLKDARVRKRKKPKLDEDNDMDPPFNGNKIPDEQPLLLTGGILKQYQIEGVKWMSTLWFNGINGILADEAGLDKTTQVVSLFCQMYEMGLTGPYLVVVPSSMIPHWSNELERLAPKVPCLLYHGDKQERMERRSKLAEKHREEEVDVDMLYVVVTSYEIAMKDRAAFSNIMWRYIVVEEGYGFKNINFRLFKELQRYHSPNRLLLTGTLLQYNLPELWSLLNFSLPEIFDALPEMFDVEDIDVDKEKRIMDEKQQNSILTKLRELLTQSPFFLRRIIAEVKTEVASQDDRKEDARWDPDEVRANIRNQYIEKIVQVNQKMEDIKQTISRNTESKEEELEDLKRKQDCEKEVLDRQSNEEKMELEIEMTSIRQRMTEREERWKRSSQEITTRYTEEKKAVEDKYTDKESHQIVTNLMKTSNQLADDLEKLDADPNDLKNLKKAREILECPICMEMMLPPTRIWMCPGSHSICEGCKAHLKGGLCPTCRSRKVTIRALTVENIARALFNR